MLVTRFPAIKHAQLYYRQLEIEKAQALKRICDKFAAQTCISDRARDDIMWWADHVTVSSKPLLLGKPDVHLTGDASGLGWGGVMDGQATGGRWSAREANFHINYLEIKAFLLTLQALCAGMLGVHVHIQSDNTTAVTYISNMGGSRALDCSEITRDLSLWCIKRDILVSISHIPGSQNYGADKASLEFNDRTEWVTDMWGCPDIDLFASRPN